MKSIVIGLLGFWYAAVPVFAQSANEPADAGKVWPAIQSESVSVRERISHALAHRQEVRLREQALSQTRRQIRAENQAQNRIRSAMRIQESLIEQDQVALRAQQVDSPQQAAIQVQLTQHQQVLGLLHSQDEQLMRVQEQLQLQLAGQQERRDQTRVR